MHMGIAELLEELFTLHGHQVTREAPLEGRSGTVYTIPILAESEVGAIVLSGHLDGSPLLGSAVADFVATVRDVGADLGILVHTGPCDASAAHAAEGRVLLWDRSLVVKLLGEAQLARSLEEKPTSLPLDPPVASAETEFIVPTTVDEMLPAAFRDPEPVLPDVPEAPTLPDLSALSVSLEDFAQDVAATAAVAADGPRKPQPPRPEEDDLQPFPPIPAVALPELPAPPALDFSEADLLTPDHPLADAWTPAAQAPVAALAPAPPVPEPVRAPVAAAPIWAVPAAPARAPLLPRMSPAAAPASSVPSWARVAAEPAAAPAAPAPARPAPVPAPAPTFAPAPAPPPAPSASVLPPFPTASNPVLPVRVRLEDAKRRVKDKLFSVRSVEVLLQPVHLYAYECDVLREGSLEFDTADGQLQVHGSDKTTIDVDPDQVNPGAPTLLSADHPYPVEERVLRISEERARQFALQHVMKKHTKSVSIRIADHNNGLYYTEKRKVEPTPDQVRVRHLGVFLRPVWRLHGSNGVVDLDATDGREVMSEVRGGRTDAILVE